jgi:hypothetical protein
MGRIVGLEIFNEEVLANESVAKIETGENAAITDEAISDAVAADVLDESKEDKKGSK